MSAAPGLRRYLEDCRNAVGGVQPWAVSGRLTRVAGLVISIPVKNN